MKPTTMCYKLALLLLIANIVSAKLATATTLNITVSSNRIVSNVTTVIDLNLITVSHGTTPVHTDRKTDNYTNSNKLHSGTVLSGSITYISICPSSSNLLTGIIQNSALPNIGRPTVSLVNDATIFNGFYLHSHNYLFYKYKTAIT